MGYAYVLAQWRAKVVVFVCLSILSFAFLYIHKVIYCIAPGFSLFKGIDYCPVEIIKG